MWRLFAFVSKLFKGSITGQDITRQSGILRLQEPGDVCMADKGFRIDQMLSDVGASLIMDNMLINVQLPRTTRCER